MVNLPHFAELTMKELVKQAAGDDQIKAYMRDDFSTKKHPSRSFLLCIIGTIYPGYFKTIINAQTKARFEQSDGDKAGSEILMNTHWASLLAEHPFQSRK